MEGTYPVMKDGVQVGQVQMEQRGLYYEIRCRCTGGEVRMTELMARTRAGTQKIGLLRPEKGWLFLEKRIAVRSLNETGLCFFLRPRELEQALFPVEAEEPFEYLQRLRGAYLVKREGKSWIAFRNTGE